MPTIQGSAAFALILAMGACTPPTQSPAPPVVETTVANAAPAGAYTIDLSHADLSFRVSHLGFAMYTARFTAFDVALNFDPANPEVMSVTAGVDVASLVLPSPPAGFTEAMLGPQWFDAARFPRMTFRSTAVQRTGDNTARVTGDLTLHGVTKPVTLDVTFNGGYAGHQMEPQGRIGFSARASLKRSEFGMGYGVPPPGSSMGVGDDVEIIIEAELTGPPWTPSR